MLCHPVRRDAMKPVTPERVVDINRLPLDGRHA